MAIRSTASILLCMALFLTFGLAGCAKKSSPPADPNDLVPVGEAIDPTPIMPAPVIEPAPAGPNDLVVTVNGTPILEKHISEMVDPQIAALKKMDPNQPAQMFDQYAKALRQSTLEMLIIESLIEPKAVEAGVTVSEEEIQEELEFAAESYGMTVEQLQAKYLSVGQNFDQVRDQITKITRYIKTAEAASPVKTTVTDEDAALFYENNKARFSTPEQIKASHILVKVEPSDANDIKAQKRVKAEAILKQINEGADFAETAIATGGFPSAARGGDLGFFGKGAMVPPFDEAAFALEVGKVSDIVETRFGYHIIKVVEKKEATETTLEDAKAGIISELSRGNKRQILSTFIGQLRAAASIVFAPVKEPQPQPGMPMMQ